VRRTLTFLSPSGPWGRVGGSHPHSPILQGTQKRPSHAGWSSVLLWGLCPNHHQQRY
jgi:hypothetical protein